MSTVDVPTMVFISWPKVTSPKWYVGNQKFSNVSWKYYKWYEYVFCSSEHLSRQRYRIASFPYDNASGWKI